MNANVTASNDLKELTGVVVGDRAAMFSLMCEYNCTPGRSSLSIPYNEGWAYVPGTKARVDLKDYATLEDAYSAVIAMAVIEKIRNAA